MSMSKKAVSVTLDVDNVLWLRGQAAGGTVSDVLNRIVTGARQAGHVSAASVRSVRGTIDLPADDADLVKADAWMRAQFERSVSRPILVREPRPRYGARAKRAAKRGGSRG